MPAFGLMLFSGYKNVPVITFLQLYRNVIYVIKFTCLKCIIQWMSEYLLLYPLAVTLHSLLSSPRQPLVYSLSRFANSGHSSIQRHLTIFFKLQFWVQIWIGLHHNYFELGLGILSI